MGGRLAPARHAGLGIVPVAAVASAVQGAESLIDGVTHLFGGSTYGQPTYEGAERSRANSYLLGIAAGSVQAGQLLIGQHQTDTSAYAQQYTQQVLAQAQSNYPQVMAQAAQAGALHDDENGTQGLMILKNLGIPYQDQYAGYSTGSGQPPTGMTAQLVQTLATLPPSGSSYIPGTSVAVPTTAAKAALPLILGVIIIGGMLATKGKGARD